MRSKAESEVVRGAERKVKLNVRGRNATTAEKCTGMGDLSSDQVEQSFVKAVLQRALSNPWRALAAKLGGSSSSITIHHQLRHWPLSRHCRRKRVI